MTLTEHTSKRLHSNHAIEESDVNRLARNDTDKAHAVVSARILQDSTVPTANSSTTE